MRNWLDANWLYIWFGFAVVILGLTFLQSREMRRRRGREPRAILKFPNLPSVEVNGEDQLRQALRQLDEVSHGQTVRLYEAPDHYLEAVRVGEFWSAVLRTPHPWTTVQFTADMTSEYSEREVRRQRDAVSLWNRLTGAAQGEQALSTRQIEDLFTSYLTGGRYSVPTIGAGGT